MPISHPPLLPEELYDLDSDPLEQVNLAGRPEIRSVQDALSSRLLEFQEETKDPILSGSIKRPVDEAALRKQAEVVLEKIGETLR